LYFFKATKFFARLFNHAGQNVLEMHSRLSQSKRQQVSDQFRRGYHPFLFSSDVSARGLDYPDGTKF
jgi:ATP-dependent RNA helicase MSS116